MIRFARQELLLEDPEGKVRGFVTRNLEWPRVINPPKRTIDSKSRCQAAAWPSMPRLRPNQLYVPSGATRWSMFLGLATKAGKDAIVAAVPTTGAIGTLELSIEGAPVVDVPTASLYGDGFNLQDVVSYEMWMLPPQPVSETDDSLWFIPLVDERYWWQKQLFVSTGTTWALLFDEIKESLGADLERDDTAPVDAKYRIPDPCIFRNGAINAAAALDAYCWSTNQRLAPDMAGGFKIRSKKSATALYDAQLLAQMTTIGSNGAAAGGAVDRSIDGEMPRHIIFHFTSDSPAELLVYESAGMPSEADGADLQLMCTMIDADAALKETADLWGQDYWLWGKRNSHLSFAGVIAWKGTGFENYVLIDRSRSPNGVFAGRTIVKSLPLMAWGYDFVPIQAAAKASRSCGGAGGAQIVQFTTSTVDCDAGTATGLVTDVLCDGAEASIGDIVELSDPLGYLIGNPALLEGQPGMAVKMSDDGLYGCIYKIISMGDLGYNCA